MGLRGNPLIHHHVGGGKQAVTVSLHFPEYDDLMMQQIFDEIVSAFP